MTTVSYPSSSELFLVTGRVIGDDEDTLFVVAADDWRSAGDAFAAMLLKGESDPSIEVTIVHNIPLAEAINTRITAPGAAEPQMTTVVAGNVVDGFEACRLFSSPEGAIEWANEDAHLPQSWCLMQVQV